MAASLETELQQVFNKLFDLKQGNANAIMRNMAIVGVEVPLLSPNSVITRGTDLFLPERSTSNIGRIDVVFRLGRTYYVAEIKDYTKPETRSFWYATKALAYCEYLKWQTDISTYKAAVVIPASSLRLEHQIVAGRLGLAIFIFKKTSDGSFKMRKVDDRPHWKQEPW